MKKIIILILLLSVVKSGTSDEIVFNNRMLITKKSESKSLTVTVTATMYYPTSGQCDSDPFLTAGMYRINPSKASQQKYIAMSRNLLKRWHGSFTYGDSVRIEGAGKKDGIYKIVDTMNARFKDRIDFLETTGAKHYKFKNVRLTKV